MKNEWRRCAAANPIPSYQATKLLSDQAKQTVAKRNQHDFERGNDRQIPIPLNHAPDLQLNKRKLKSGIEYRLNLL